MDKLLASILNRPLSENVEDRRGAGDDEIRAMMENHPVPELMRTYGRTPQPLYEEPTQSNPLLDQLRKSIAGGMYPGVTK